MPPKGALVAVAEGVAKDVADGGPTGAPVARLEASLAAAAGRLGGPVRPRAAYAVKARTSPRSPAATPIRKNAQSLRGGRRVERPVSVVGTIDGCGREPPHRGHDACTSSTRRPHCAQEKPTTGSCSLHRPRASAGPAVSPELLTWIETERPVVRGGRC